MASLPLPRQTSSRCSFDVPIWEELHLKSLSSTSFAASATDTASSTGDDDALPPPLGPLPRDAMSLPPPCDLHEMPASVKSVLARSMNSMSDLQHSHGRDTDTGLYPPSDDYSTWTLSSVPFKWEEAPGIPKQQLHKSQSSNSAIPLLTPPPRLQTKPLDLPNLLSPMPASVLQCAVPGSVALSSSLISSLTSTTNPHLRKTDLCSTSCRSLRRSAQDENASRHKASVWQSFIQSGRRSYRQVGSRAKEALWSSSTSTLLGLGGKRTDASDSNSFSQDALCLSPSITEALSSLSLDDDENSAGSMNSAAGQERASFFPSSFPHLGPPSPSKKKGISSATVSLRQFLWSCKLWKRNSLLKNRNREIELWWEPALATYIHSMELERSSSVDIHSCSGQLAQPDERNGPHMQQTDESSECMSPSESSSDGCSVSWNKKDKWQIRRIGRSAQGRVLGKLRRRAAGGGS